MHKSDCEYMPDQWRLFIDSGKESLKAVLWHNGFEKPSVPVVYARQLKESYESMRLILKLINYLAHNWNICGDLKACSTSSWITVGLYTAYVLSVFVEQ